MRSGNAFFVIIVVSSNGDWMSALNSFIDIFNWIIFEHPICVCWCVSACVFVHTDWSEHIREQKWQHPHHYNSHIRIHLRHLTPISCLVVLLLRTYRQKYCDRWNENLAKSDILQNGEALTLYCSNRPPCVLWYRHGKSRWNYKRKAIKSLQIRQRIKKSERSNIDDELQLWQWFICIFGSSPRNKFCKTSTR